MGINHDINSKQGKIGKISQEYRSVQYNVKKMEDQNRNLQKKVLQAEKLQKEVAVHNIEMEDARKELEQRMTSAGHGLRRKLSASASIPSGVTEEDMFGMNPIQEGDEEEEGMKMAPLNPDGETRTLFSRNPIAVKLKSESGMTLQSEQTSESSATGSTPRSSDEESSSGSGSDGTQSSDEDSDS